MPDGCIWTPPLGLFENNEGGDYSGKVNVHFSSSKIGTYND